MKKNNQKIKKNNQPTFLGVGAMKCATTWLSECLRSHPEVFVSEIKELHFFSTNWEKGEDWYLNHFKNTDKKMVGEFSVSYMDEPIYTDRILEVLGPIKIIISVRNPVERFISHYKHNYRVKKEMQQLSPNIIDEKNFKTVSSTYPEMLSKGLYSQHIKRFQNKFGKDNVFVLFKDDIDNNPLSTVSSLYEYLGVSKEFVPIIVKKKVSPGIVPKYKSLENSRVFLYGRIKKYFPKGIIWVRKFRIAELYRKLNKRNSDFKITQAVKKQLQEYYIKDISEMEKLFNRDLKKWKTQ